MQFLYNSQSHTITKADYHSIVILYCHNIITPNGWSHFRSQVKVENTYWVFYPFSKEVSPKIRALRAITLKDASANADQKFIAPPKPHFLLQKSAPEIFAKISSKKHFRRRTMKSCKLSKTRFAKVSRRSEPCSGGKRPFEVSNKKIASRRSKR